MTSNRSKQLTGLQRLWFVLTMIWIVLAAAVKVPGFPVGAEAYDWARSEIENQLRAYEQQARGGGASRSSAVDAMAHQPDQQYVDTVLADKGAQAVAGICAAHPACPAADQWLVPALTGIEAELQRRLAVIEREQRALLIEVSALCLLPPLLVYLVGWLLARLLGARPRTIE